MEIFATPYPLVFFDGEEEHEKGSVGVHSVLNFKRFQALLSQKIGLPAKQLSAVFVCKKTMRDKEIRQKLPINANTNFNIILNQHNPTREKGCYFLVSIKRSKKERKGTTKRRMAGSENGDEDASSYPSGCFSTDEPANSDGCRNDAFLVDDASSPNEGDRSSNLIALWQNDELHYTIAPEGKLLGAEQILLWRDREQQATHGSSSTGWQDGCERDHREVASPPLSIQSNTPRLSASSSTRHHNDRVHVHISEKQRAKAGCMDGCHSMQSDSSIDDASPPNERWDRSANLIVLWQNDELHCAIAPEGKLMGAEQILLWRDSGSSGAGWPDGCERDHREVASPRLSIGSNTPRRSASISTRHHDDRVHVHISEKQRLQAESMDRCHSMQSDQPVQLRTQSDSIASPGRSALLQRNVILSPVAYATPFPPNSTFLSLPKPSLGAARVLSGAARNLQEAQAHYLSLQMQHPLQMPTISPLFPKAREALRGRPSFKSWAHERTGACRHCFGFKEKNISPMPFHLCAQDRVTVGFHGPSPAGPIERPVKRLQTVA